MLDRPDILEPQFFGQFHLLERVIVNGTFAFAAPGARYGQFKGDPELHGDPSPEKLTGAPHFFRRAAKIVDFCHIGVAQLKRALAKPASFISALPD
jgi:hypothetical protein